MSSISKPDHCTERPSLVLLSAYQGYLMTFKLMTSQVVQRARPLITHICVIGAQRGKAEPLLTGPRFIKFIASDWYSKLLNCLSPGVSDHSLYLHNNDNRQTKMQPHIVELHKILQISVCPQCIEWKSVLILVQYCKTDSTRKWLDTTPYES